MSRRLVLGVQGGAAARDSVAMVGAIARWICVLQARQVEETKALE